MKKERTIMRELITAEYVGRGHPDKIADQISDLVLEMCIDQDPRSRVAVETMIKDNHIILGGEVTTNADLEQLNSNIANLIKEIGYDDEINAISYRNLDIVNLIGKQSNNISNAVDDGGAGDQGIVVGGATDETPDLMPVTYMIARDLIRAYERYLSQGMLRWARPDCKSQVTIEYIDGKPSKIKTIVMSVQHATDVRNSEIEQAMIWMIEKELQKKYPALYNQDIEYMINTSGAFIIGGPKGDAGVTGRKIIVDTYGSYFRHGGGAFSGKDFTKTDRSGAYYARRLAKEIVKANLARKCEVEITFALGHKTPVSVRINTFGTELYPKAISRMKAQIQEVTIQEIIKSVETMQLDIKKLSYDGMLQI